MYDSPIDTIELTAALSSFPSVVRARVRALHRPPFTGIIAAADVTPIVEELSTTIDELMPRLVPLAARFAKPPVSNFFVGAVARGVTTGNLYYGANLEFAGESLGHSLHAEQSAVANAWMSGERGIDAIAVSAAPCGHCRQFVNELTTADTLVVTTPDGTDALHTLLPKSFGPGELDGAARLMAPVHLRLTADARDELARAALAAANMSHAPYSRSYAGAALRTADGAIFAGAYAENVAFNPSLPPLQAALSQLNLAGRSFDEIREAVLVHVGDIHLNSTRTVLAAVCDATLRTVEARNSR